MASIDVPITIGFDHLAEAIHTWARGRGFYDREKIGDIDNPSLPAEKLLLIVSECVEVLEALRDGNQSLEAEELADIVIRCLDYAAWRGISLDDEILKKMKKNATRPHLHGRQF